MIKSDAQIDADLDAYCAQFNVTPEFRAGLRADMVRTRDAMREAQQNELLPLSMQRTLLAEQQAKRLASEGGDHDAVEAWQFNGIPRDAHRMAPHEVVMRLSAGHRLRDVRLGTMALIAATAEARDRGQDAAQRTASRKAAEAALFASAETQRMLSAAGWSQGDINGD